MSAKREREVKEQRKPFNLEEAIGLLQRWVKLRKLRDQGGGSMEESESVLSRLSGKFTDIEEIYSLMNAYEREALEAVAIWRDGLSYEPEGEADSGMGIDPSAEMLRCFEEFRAIAATGDRDLLRVWFKEQSWSTRLLIPRLFTQERLKS
jgi:hypothetical protein